MPLCTQILRSEIEAAAKHTKGMTTPAPTHSTRWSPTPEQLMVLEEMYRNGVKTPNAAQIQQITAQLSRYGRIQGKNVFYWFQNHKARERQKIRRWLGRVYTTGAAPRGPCPYPYPLLLPAPQLPLPAFPPLDQVGAPSTATFHEVASWFGLRNTRNK